MKKALVLFMALAVAVAAFAGCGQTGSSTPASQAPSSVASAAPSQAASTPNDTEPVTLNIAGLKGPTTMGMVKLMKDAESVEGPYTYAVEMFGAADAIVPKLVSGDVDMAAIPANLAANIYGSTGGKVQVAAINTLGVLYVVETGSSIQSIEDLRGRTIYSTGKGTTPEFALNYILTRNGIDPASDVNIEFKAEATEVAALLNDATDAVAVLPQPYVTAVQAQNEAVRIALDLTEEWDKVGEGSSLVTGVLVVRTEVLQQSPQAVAAFLQDYKASIEWVNANTADAAALVAEYGIVEKAPVAQKALPYCNIVYIDGEEMQQRLGGYLQALYDQNPEAVGGGMPGEDFYLAV